MKIPKKELAWRKLGDYLVVVNIKQHSFHVLNETAAEVWLGLFQGKSITFLVEKISEMYGVQQEMVREDVEALLLDLSHKGLVVNET